MAPSGRRTTASRKKTSTSTRTRKQRNTHNFKKQPLQSKETSTITMSSSSSSSSTISSNNFSKKESNMGFEDTIEVSSVSACSTPKAQRFQIPEILTCPPAPKKQRVHSNCSLHRSPIAFFAPPDLELFFFFALGNIPV
ncbi:Cyclin-dependent protein kinase inhibitor SMR13 [Quillaja saponaria]|uniref:Cyclin-dependent protein kinase inhibitor SMR13 n=1 Tax=Quillaja saponaria TaxID=32244 RepID=A0AAD7LMJ6_QUISA|nr:Cyclin-dependent protein kinase inhibitor SMR13 [Quillaja saponaria]